KRRGVGCLRGGKCRIEGGCGVDRLRELQAKPIRGVVVGSTSWCQPCCAKRQSTTRCASIRCAAMGTPAAHAEKMSGREKAVGNFNRRLWSVPSQSARVWGTPSGGGPCAMAVDPAPAVMSGVLLGGERRLLYGERRKAITRLQSVPTASLSLAEC